MGIGISRNGLKLPNWFDVVMNIKYYEVVMISKQNTIKSGFSFIAP